VPSDLDPAIAALERHREEALAKAAEYERTINTLCVAAGYAPRYSDSTSTNSLKVTQISDDTFYSMKQTPAMRMYLDMRKAQGLGPATTRDLFEALKQGGYVFEAKSDDIAMVGMRALLRTQPNVFHRLPQGTWGLSAWYPDAKKPNEESKKKTAPVRKTRAASKLRKAPSPAKRRSSPQHPKGKGASDVVHQPDNTD
jgi:hypothetical protein